MTTVRKVDGRKRRENPELTPPDINLVNEIMVLVIQVRRPSITSGINARFPQMVGRTGPRFRLDEYDEDPQD